MPVSRGMAAHLCRPSPEPVIDLGWIPVRAIHLGSHLGRASGTPGIARAAEPISRVSNLTMRVPPTPADLLLELTALYLDGLEKLLSTGNLLLSHLPLSSFLLCHPIILHPFVVFVL